VAEVLKKPREYRDYDDGLLLLNWVDTVPLLQGMGTSRLMDMCRRMYYDCADDEEIIIKQFGRGKVSSSGGGSS